VNVLSAPPPSAVSSASSGTGDGASARGDGSFAAMMDPGKNPTAAVTRPKGSDRPQDAGQAQQRTSRPAKPATTPEPEADAAATADAATAKADEHAPAPGTDTDATAEDWPPPGLAGLLGLTSPAQPAATGPQMQGEAAPDALPPGATGAGAALPAPIDAASAPAVQSPATGSPVAALPLAAQAPAAGGPAPQAEPAVVETGAAAVEPSARAAIDPTALQIDGPDAPAFVLPAASAAPASATATATQAPVELPPHLPRPDLQGDAFADEIGTSMRWMADQKIGHAHIRISPQDLGPIEVRLHLDGDRVSADFSSAQPDVRQALEQSIPRLRDMLGQSGFQLSHAGVGHQDGGRQQEGGRARPGAGDQDGGAADNAPVSARQIRLRGLLDAYA